MWDAFYEDIDGKEFDSREDYENWVKGWTETTISEAGRLERWALNTDQALLIDELSIKIKEDK